MQYGERNIFLILPKSNSNFSIGTVNFSSCTKWASKLKVGFYERNCSKFIRTSTFICQQSSFLFQHGKKNYEHIYHSPLHVSGIAENILKTIIRFAHYHLLLASNSTFMTDSQYLGAIQIW